MQISKNYQALRKVMKDVLLHLEALVIKVLIKVKPNVAPLGLPYRLIFWPRFKKFDSPFQYIIVKRNV